jgi:hypothetical protein
VPAELQLDNVGVCAGGYDEVVLERAPVAVVDEVNALVDGLVADPGVSGDVRQPLAGLTPFEVVDAAGQLLCHGGGDAFGPDQFHRERRGPRRLLFTEREDGPGRGEQGREAAGARDEVETFVGLALVALELEGQLAVSLARARAARLKRVRGGRPSRLFNAGGRGGSGETRS